MTNNPNSIPPIIKRVTSEEMCKRFNEGGYWDRTKTGELTVVLMESNVSTLLTQETVEITSQMLSYRDHDDNEIVRVHQFVRPDGSLAASGMPDPKRLLEGGVLYRLMKKQKA